MQTGRQFGSFYKGRCWLPSSKSNRYCKGDLDLSESWVIIFEWNKYTWAGILARLKQCGLCAFYSVYYISFIEIPITLKNYFISMQVYDLFHTCSGVMIYKKYKYLMIQMTKIDFSWIFGFHSQFLAHSSPNPWNFPSVERVTTVLLGE